MRPLHLITTLMLAVVMVTSSAIAAFASGESSTNLELAAAADTPAGTGSIRVVQQGEWFIYEHEQRLPGKVERVTLDGQQLKDDGCRFSEEGGGEASEDGPRVLVIRDVAFNPSTCTMVSERTHLSLPEAVAAGFVDADEAPTTYEGEVEDRTVSTSGGAFGAQPLATTHYYGYLKVNVEDPVQIDVTTTKASVDWTATSSCVTSSTRSARWGWYSPSGWGRTNAWWQEDQSCSRAYSNVYGKYRNGVFCVGIDTWTEHKKTWFEGRPAGGWYWSYSVDKWGGCNWLLHYERIVLTP